jgi:hypothetical protein
MSGSSDIMKQLEDTIINCQPVFQQEDSQLINELQAKLLQYKKREKVLKDELTKE